MHANCLKATRAGSFAAGELLKHRGNETNGVCPVYNILDSLRRKVWECPKGDDARAAVNAGLVIEARAEGEFRQLLNSPRALRPPPDDPPIGNVRSRRRATSNAAARPKPPPSSPTSRSYRNVAPPMSADVLRAANGASWRPRERLRSKWPRLGRCARRSTPQLSGTFPGRQLLASTLPWSSLPS